MSILQSYSKNDVVHFNKDIVQVVRIAKEIDRFYGRCECDIDKYLPKYKKFIESFNKKYKGVEIKVRVCLDCIKTRLLLKSESIRKIFDDAASKVIGLKAVGVARFNIVDVTDGNGFIKEVDKGKKQLHITYYDPELGIRCVFLSCDEKEKMVELHYDDKQIVLDNSPEFKIACFYALKDGFDRKIKIHEEGATFGFDDLLSEREKAEWFHEKLNPNVLE